LIAIQVFSCTTINTSYHTFRFWNGLPFTNQGLNQGLGQNGHHWLKEYQCRVCRENYVLVYANTAESR
jgi:hypothetical protein